MPELPEVETVARQLNQVLPGRTIGEVQVRRDKSFLSQAALLQGKTIASVSRKAKNIIIEFGKPSHSQGVHLATPEELPVLLIHLKMTGQLVWRAPSYGVTDSARRGALDFTVYGGHPTPDWVQALPSKHTRIVCHFTDDSVLYFNDMRVFGWWKVISKQALVEMKKRMPPDVIDAGFTLEYLVAVLKKSTQPVKLVLLDQAKIGGLGNIYVNDALWLAGAKPTRSSQAFSLKEIRKIHAACIQVIQRGIETGGASESTYKHINGLGGTYQEEFLIYKREGEGCGKAGCGGIIQKTKLGGRGTYWCPVCQR